MNDSVKFGLAWSSPPDELHLNEREVHVWLVQMDDPRVDIDDYDRLLSTDEKQRASRFKFPRDRRRYVISHAALRSILGTYLIVPPGELRFWSGPNGKPKLVRIPGKQEIPFNLSHSHEIAVVAVAQRCEIGVDVEHVREDFRFEEVAQRFFSPKEIAGLAALPSDLQRVAFFKCWTSKEAFLKAKGTGLAGKLDEVELVLTDRHAVSVKGTIPDWCLAEVSLNQHYAAAVVVEGDECHLANYQWEAGRLT